MQSKISFITKLDFYESVYLKKLIKNAIEKSEKVLNILQENNLETLTYIDQYHINELKFYYNNILIIQNDIEGHSISEDSIYKLNYCELLILKNIIELIRMYSGEREVLENEYELIYRIINYKKNSVLNRALDISEMELEDYYILLQNIGSNNKENYAIDCGVDEEDLTPEVMYNKYHVRSIRRG